MTSKAKKETNTLLDQMSGPPREPKGTRVKITSIGRADQAYIPLAKGDEGTVVGGNDLQIWVEFDKGVQVTLLAGIDHYEVLSRPTERKAS